MEHLVRLYKLTKGESLDNYIRKMNVTSEDMEEFMKFLLKQGNYYGQILLERYISSKHPRTSRFRFPGAYDNTRTPPDKGNLIDAINNELIPDFTSIVNQYVAQEYPVRIIHHEYHDDFEVFVVEYDNDEIGYMYDLDGEIIPLGITHGVGMSFGYDGHNLWYCTNYLLGAIPRQDEDTGETLWRVKVNIDMMCVTVMDGETRIGIVYGNKFTVYNILLQEVGKFVLSSEATSLTCGNGRFMMTLLGGNVVLYSGLVMTATLVARNQEGEAKLLGEGCFAVGKTLFAGDDIYNLQGDVVQAVEFNDKNYIITAHNVENDVPSFIYCLEDGKVKELGVVSKQFSKYFPYIRGSELFITYATRQGNDFPIVRLKISKSGEIQIQQMGVLTEYYSDIFIVRSSVLYVSMYKNGQPVTYKSRIHSDRLYDFPQIKQEKVEKPKIDHDGYGIYSERVRHRNKFLERKHMRDLNRAIRRRRQKGFFGSINHPPGNFEELIAKEKLRQAKNPPPKFFM